MREGGNIIDLGGQVEETVARVESEYPIGIDFTQQNSFEDLFGVGADEMIDLVMRLFVEPGDAVLNCPPTFGIYPFDAAVNGARVLSLPRRRPAARR